MKTIYIIGAFRAKNQWLQERNVRRCEDMIQNLIQVCGRKINVISVQTMYRNFSGTQPDSYWLQCTMATLELCHAAFVIQSQETLLSEGSRAEILRCEELGIPVFYFPIDVSTWVDTLENGGEWPPTDTSAPSAAAPESGRTPSGGPDPQRESSEK